MVPPPFSDPDRVSLDAETPGPVSVPDLLAILEALGDAAVVFSAEERICAANRRAGSLVGAAASALIGLTGAQWEARLAQSFSPVPEAEAPGNRRPGTDARGEFLRSVGYPRRLLCRERRPLGDAGGPSQGALELFSDITDETRAQQDLERQEIRLERDIAALELRLEQAEKFKMELTANVTHDLRTPLASIKASVSGLLAGDIAYDPQEARETLTLIEEETDRLQRRVQNLLSMASMESGGAEPRRDWVDITDVVATALESLRSVRAGREVRLDLPEDVPLVLADYDQLLIAIRNLIENAFLYSPPGSPLDVSASVGLGQLRVRVRDYGAGLMPDEFERIFDKFYRGRSARRIPGTGLGLPICRGIAEAHGGRLWAEHVPGGGVAFVLSVPLNAHEPEEVVG